MRFASAKEKKNNRAQFKKLAQSNYRNYFNRASLMKCPCNLLDNLVFFSLFIFIFRKTKQETGQFVSPTVAPKVKTPERKRARVSALLTSPGVSYAENTLSSSSRVQDTSRSQDETRSLRFRTRAPGTKWALFLVNLISKVLRGENKRKRRESYWLPATGKRSALGERDSRRRLSGCTLVAIDGPS